MSRNFKFFFLPSSVVVGALIFFMVSSAQAGLKLNKEDQTLIHQIIEQYIQDHPEKLRDALIALAAREEQARLIEGLAKVRLDDGDPVMGNVNGNIVVYQFTDYNCGYCKRMFMPIQKMLSYNDDVRMIVKEFPILSQSSLIAARAGIAAQVQGKFLSFHSKMMNYRGQISEASIMEAARTAGLDLDRLQQDMDSATTSAIIERTRDGAAALKLNGTPALVIGDTVIPGAISLKELQEVIDRERARQS